MKKSVLIIGIILVLIIGCKNKELLEIKDIPEIKYISENKNNIITVIVHKTTLGSNNCYNVDVETAFDRINQIIITKKSNISVTDDYLTYIFIFDDNKKESIHFEGKYLVNNKESYTIENFPQIELKEEDIIDCQY